MDLKKSNNQLNDDSMQRLLDSSQSDQSNLHSSPEQPPQIIVNELNEQKLENDSKSTSRKSKFLVIKHNESNLTQKNVTGSTQSGLDKNYNSQPNWDFNDYPEKLNKINNYQKGSFLNLENNNEEDDLFLDEPFKEFNILQNRENEGQDTITSLSNNIYRKQLEKIRRKASLRSSTTNSGTSSGSTTPTDDKNYLQSSDNSLNTPFLAIKSIFKSQESLFSKKSFKLFGSINTLPQENAMKNLSTPMNRSNLNLNLKSQTSLGTSTCQSITGSSKKRFSIKENSKLQQSDTNIENVQLVSTSKSDQMFDVISSAINNKRSAALDKEFIDNVLYTVKKQQLKQQKKKDKAKRVCLFAELLVFTIVIVMTFYFAKTVIYQIEIIKNINNFKSNLTLIKFNSTNYNNNMYS